MTEASIEMLHQQPPTGAALSTTAPAAPLLPPSGATVPTAAATTKTRNSTTLAAEMAMALVALEEEEYDRCNSTDPRRRLDDDLLRLADGILLCLIAAMIGERGGIGGESMPTIDISALFIGREEQEGNNGSNVTTEDDNSADVESGEYLRNFLEVVLSQLWDGRFGRTTTTNTKTTETTVEPSERSTLAVFFHELTVLSSNFGIS